VKPDPKGLNMIEYILIVCLSIFMAILFVPIFFCIQASKNQKILFSVRINWFFSAVCCNFEKKENKELEIDVKILGIRIKTKTKKTKKKKKESKYNFKALINKSFLSRIFKFMGKVLKHIAIREFRARIFYGFDDPADTGTLCGFIALFSSYFYGYDIKFNPFFDREIFEGELFLKGQIFCFVIIFYTLQLVLSKTFRETIKKAKKN